MLLNNKKCPNCETYYDPTLKKCPHCYKSNELYLDGQINDKIMYFSVESQIGLFLVGFAFGGMLLVELLFSYIISLFDIDLALKKTILLATTYVTMLLGLMAIAFFTRRKEFLSKYKRGLDYIYGVFYAMTIVFASMMLSSLINIFYTPVDNNNQSAALEVVQNYPIIAFFIISLLGPICEEMTYRVGLFSFFRRINKYVAFIITIIVFALIHFDFDAIGTSNIVNELWALPSYIVSGFILTLAYEHRGPVCSMTAHILYNTFAFIMMLIHR